MNRAFALDVTHHLRYRVLRWDLQEHMNVIRHQMYRLLRACCAHAEQWREPFTGALECQQHATRVLGDWIQFYNRRPPALSSGLL